MFSQCERQFIKSVDFEQFKGDKGKQTKILEQAFQFEMMKDIPSQIEKFFELQRFDIDLSPDEVHSDLSSPRQTFSKQSPNKQPNLDLTSLLLSDQKSEEIKRDDYSTKLITSTPDHQLNIKLSIEQERQRLIFKAIQAGIPEQDVEAFL